MEAAGVYWKPVWAILEAVCVQARQRAPRQAGPLTQDRPERRAVALPAGGGGPVARESRPPKPIRTLRSLTRYRKSQIRDRQREAGRLHKLLEDAGIKPAYVASELLGKYGRAMLEAAIAGTTDPDVLADLALGNSERSFQRSARRCRATSIRHAIIIGQILAHIDFLDEASAKALNAIEKQIAPLAPAVEAICTIPGVQRRTAKMIIAETGGDRTTFPTAKHLASWARGWPGNDHSAGERRSGRTRTRLAPKPAVSLAAMKTILAYAREYPTAYLPSHDPNRSLAFGPERRSSRCQASAD